MFKQLFVLKIALFSSLFALPAVAQRIDGVTTFGDSLSDNGNAFKATNGLLPPSPPYVNGRFSNGSVWVENIISEFKFPTTSSPNFAVGGATSGTDNGLNPLLGGTITLPGLTTELDNFLKTSPTVNPNQLFVIWAGANDYTSGQTNPAVTVTNLATAVQRLVTAGAQQLVVPNLPDLGKTPLGLANPVQGAGLSQLSAGHNSGLKVALQTLAQNNPNISIIPTDIGALFNAAITNPGRFGFTNVTQACTAVACTTPNTFLFFDDRHPTAAGHRLIAAYALNTLTAPQTIAPQVESALRNARRQTRDLNGRLLTLRTAPPSVDHQVSVFVNGDWNSGDRSNTSNTTGFKIDTKGVTVGADYPVTDNLAVGLAFSNASSNNNLNDNNGKVALNSSSVSVYGSYTQEKFYTDALFNYGWDNFDLTRNIKVVGFNSATAKPSGNQFSARVSGGYDLGSNNLAIGPTVGIRYTKVNINGYTESNGDILNLKVNPQDADSLMLNLGAQVSYPFKSQFGTISPYFAANYEHEFANNSRKIVTELVTQPGIPMRTSIDAGDRDFVRLSTGVQAQFVNNLSGVLGYERVFGNNSSDNYLNAQIRYQF